jgi:eukaryotic-like serine/threonine-protein kinase
MKYCSLCKEKFEDSVSFCPTDGEVLEEDSGSLVGKVLDGQYQIEALLGKGGMGAVFRARHILLGDRVAIKVLPPEMRSNSEWLRRFQREGQAARRFRHPNAVTVYDLRTSADGTIYLVMEYVEGATLDAELKKRGRFSPAEAVAVLNPIMSVLNAAHAMGVVHRDLKPENIMIGKPSTGGEPVVKLLDLGIAKLREVAGAEKTGNTNLTIAGQMLGTPYYMSPEQWGELPHDGNSEIDGRADIYSLGIVIYELVAGQRPFNGLSLPELRRQHVSEAPKPLQEMVNVPPAFSQAVARAIAKDRGERQPTAGELEKELVAALATQGMSPSAIDLSQRATQVIEKMPPPPPTRVTAANETAATLVGESDDVQTIEPRPAQATDAPSQASTMPTVVAAPRETGTPPPTMVAQSWAGAPAAAPAKKRSPLPFVLAVVFVLLLVVGGGGFALWRMMGGSKPSESKATTPAATANAPEVAAGGHEIGRYWLELNEANKSDAVRAGESLNLRSGQQFKFHFSPSENGFLYILGPGNNNALTTFLTAKPASDFGVESNEVKSGADFIFPADTGKNENWLNLDQKPGSDEFTIVFAQTALTDPRFFADHALHELTANERQDLSDLVAKSKANLLGTEVIKTGSSPFVSVKVPQTNAEGAPVIFRITIEHK